MSDFENLEVKAEQPVASAAVDYEALLKVQQDFQNQVAVKPVVASIKVGRPSKSEFFQVNPELGMQAGLIKAEDATYIVLPKLIQALSAEVAIYQLFATVNRTNGLTIWPIRMPDATGRLDDWNASALEAAGLAKTQWIRLVSDRPNGCYQPMIATVPLPEPNWPDFPWSRWLELGFKGKMIEDMNHLVLRRLRGEA